MSRAHLNKKQRRRKRDALIERYGMRCWLCHKPIRNRVDFSIDHVVPRAKGGSNGFDNLRPAHKVCNFARADGDPPELLLTEQMMLRVPEAA